MISEVTTERTVTVTFTEDEARKIHAFTRNLPIVGAEPAVFTLFQTLDRTLRGWAPQKERKRRYLW